jgi:hypothetical protein
MYWAEPMSRDAAMSLPDRATELEGVFSPEPIER